jgi:hypothetical protein
MKFVCNLKRIERVSEQNDYPNDDEPIITRDGNGVSELGRRARGNY